MIRHLTQADYRRQPWANGRGETVEIARADDTVGLLWRLSVATVAEDGAFSLFPGIDRNLTVIEGPGFDLAGPGLRMRADLLVPVAFAGDIPLAAERVAAPSRDFNVMVARGRMRAEVRHAAGAFGISGQVVAIHAVGAGIVVVNGGAIAASSGDTLLLAGTATVHAAASVLAVALDPVR
ncbi:MAG: HutD family protein [Paracoccaceae bacterium]|nr:MAG: HutD family protein [Paracoccaceae bacterium]